MVSGPSVVVIDDQRLVREGLAHLISPHLDVLGTAADGREGLALCRRAVPDVALVDVVMPVMDGPAFTTEAIRTKAVGAVLAITTYDLDAHAAAMLRAGASGFVLKDMDSDELVRAIRVVHDGDRLLAPSLTCRLLDRFVATGHQQEAVAQLSSRETEVLLLVSDGKSNAEVARELHLSVSTIKTHIGHLLAKLDRRDRVGLVIAAYESGLVRPGGQ